MLWKHTPVHQCVYVRGTEKKALWLPRLESAVTELSNGRSYTWLYRARPSSPSRRTLREPGAVTFPGY
ncbi:hypothetical protein E2C01_039756 [Portunus trituberculatus]|uniref:Uncharacterized protein n=1 Tax=Portunus trituberculatus TaxID=210409 RepID=A0A5B7FKS9_PORTR|nr:hypothetical protein [Portunus trituberculatus]